MEKQAEQAIKDGELQYCKNCDKVQPVELTYFNPDEDIEPTLIVCLVCGESIGFIDCL
jgi:hypothetical protein